MLGYLGMDGGAQLDVSEGGSSRDWYWGFDRLELGTIYFTVKSFSYSKLSSQGENNLQTRIARPKSS